jgi:hypothetical protein
VKCLRTLCARRKNGELHADNSPGFALTIDCAMPLRRANDVLWGETIVVVISSDAGPSSPAATPYNVPHLHACVRLEITSHPLCSLEQASDTIMVLLVSLLFAALASAKCFEPANAHPLPEYDPHDPLLQIAFESISTALTIAVAAPEYASTSFSVEVTSSKETLWSLHHTARERNASRPDIPQVNGDALYRIASITKTFTVLGILYQHAAGNLSLDDTVNKYLPQLGDKSDGGIPWKDITLRSLASQLSGIPRECMSFDKHRLMFEGCHTAQGTHADLFTRGTGRLHKLRA